MIFLVDYLTITVFSVKHYVNLIIMCYVCERGREKESEREKNRNRERGKERKRGKGTLTKLKGCLLQYASLQI